MAVLRVLCPQYPWATSWSASTWCRNQDHHWAKGCRLHLEDSQSGFLFWHVRTKLGSLFQFICFVFPIFFSWTFLEIVHICPWLFKVNLKRWIQYWWRSKRGTEWCERYPYHLAFLQLLPSESKCCSIWSYVLPFQQRILSVDHLLSWKAFQT